MKFTLSWLRDHLDTKASLEEITAKLTLIGLEVEGVSDPAAALKPFTIARVIEAKPHPNADRLRVAQVEIEAGKPPVEVVCGAPNCKTGMIGVFAPIGAYIPGTKITLDKRPVRGVVSNGMLVSERELMLSDDHEGIIELEAKHTADIGKRYVDLMGLDDPVIEVKLTPNRPDCTGVRGIARDLAAAGVGALKPEPVLKGVEGTFACPVEIRLDLAGDTASACSAFYGRYVKGVKNGPSPRWLKARLEAVGLRPISALVDVTNYISLDRGRPLHVYDADKLKGAIRARMGTKGEKFLALDGKTYAADPETCVIADDSGPLGLGGIIGGESTGCTEATKNVLIECAYFDPLRIAASGRRAGVVTDARYRFERGVDPAFLERGLDLATDMVMKLAGGTPSKAAKVGTAPTHAEPIAFDYARVEKLAGVRVGAEQGGRILAALGFKVEAKGKGAIVTAPSWRPDIGGSADLVEEIVRIVGLDQVPFQAMPRSIGVTRAVLTVKQRRARRVRRVLAGRGLVEAITWSFVSKRWAEPFGGGAGELELMNPISADMSLMRPTPLPGLIEAAERNRARGHGDVALFELGQAYRNATPEGQLLIAAGVRVGAARLVGEGRHWREPAGPADLYDVKADVMAALAAAGFDAKKAQVARDAPGWYHPGRSAVLRLGPKTVLAAFGELNPGLLAALDVKGPVAAFEVFLDALPAEKARGSRARPALELSEFMPVERDFAFVIDAKTDAGDLVRAAEGADKALISEVSVFDVFEGKALGEGKRSVGLQVKLAPKDRTLTEAEIDAVGKKIIAAVAKATGAEIRG